LRTKVRIDSIDVQDPIGLCHIQSFDTLLAPKDIHNPLAKFSLFSIRQQKVIGLGNFILTT
jgi:hypothetical protein